MTPSARAAPIGLAIRFVWGALLLVVPGVVLRLEGTMCSGRTPLRVMRILGARHLLQAIAEWRGGARSRRVGIAIDILHAGTDIGFAALDPRWRRTAVTDAAVTAGFVVLAVTNF